VLWLIVSESNRLFRQLDLGRPARGSMLRPSWHWSHVSFGCIASRAVQQGIGMIAARSIERLLFRCMMFAGFLFLTGCSGPNTNGTSVLSQISVGETMLGYGDFEKAYALLDAIAADNPHSSVAALGLADAYFRQKAYLKAAIHYRKAADLGARMESLLGLARVELARNNPQGAKVFLQEILRVSPNSLEALNAMGIAHDLEGHHDLAQQFYRAALAYAPSDEKALNNCALSLALSGRAWEAYSPMAELFRSNQDNTTIRQNLALVQYLAGDRHRAMDTALLDLTESQAKANFAQISKLPPVH